MTHNKEFLISELQRFYRENNKVPIQKDMQAKFGYPSFWSYHSHFGSFNNALEIAEFEANRTHEKRTGTETCCKCGNHLKKGKNWITKGLPKGEVMCSRCYQKTQSDYMNNRLNKNSTTGSGFIAQRVIAKYLNLELKNDCNCSDDFNHPIDLYDKVKYKYINVKSSQLLTSLYKSPYWHFKLTQKVIPDTYIMVGFDENRKNILKAWATDPLDDLTYDEVNERPKKVKSITNTSESLKQYQLWEMDAIALNKILHKISNKRKKANGKGCILNNNDLINFNGK